MAHRTQRRLLLLWLVGLTLGGDCDGEEPEARETSVAGELRIVRGEGADAPVLVREATEVAVGTRAEIGLDGGASLVVVGPLSVTVDDEGAAALAGMGEGSRVFVEAPRGPQQRLTVGETALLVAGAKVSIEAGEGGPEAYVASGSAAVHRGDLRLTVGEGEAVTLGEHPETRDVTLWDDWTGGLGRAEPASGAASRGIGQLVGRVPDVRGEGLWPLVMERLKVTVRVQGDLAITEIEQVFFNPASESVEGIYTLHTPPGAELERFAVDRDGRLVDGYIKERAAAARSYARQVYRGSTLDPALLEWKGPGEYSARIYPIQAGATRRVAVRYTEWLPGAGEGRLYRLPIGAGAAAPTIHEAEITFQVESPDGVTMMPSHGAVVEGNRALLRASDFQPRADFRVYLSGAPSRTARRAAHAAPNLAPGSAAPAGPRHDYLRVPIYLPEDAFGGADEGLDVVVVADVSAGTDPGPLEMGLRAVESIAAQLGEGDRIAILASDVSARGVSEDDQLGPASRERVAGLLDALARTPAGGASDLGAAVADAITRLEDGRRGVVVYVGDGAATVGELAPGPLGERLDRLARPARVYAVAVGDAVTLPMLEVLGRHGGAVHRAATRDAATHAAMDVVRHARRRVVHGVTVDLGADAEGVYPKHPVTVVEGEPLEVLARVRSDAPSRAKVSWPVAGETREIEVPLEVVRVEDQNDLRSRWAGARLAELLRGGASRAEVVDLGVRHGILTPYTSFYVPSAAELSSLGPDAIRQLEHDPLHLGPVRYPRESESRVAEMIPALLGFGLTGCGMLSSDEEPPMAMAEPTSYEEESAEMGDMEAERSSNRYAIAGDAEGAMAPGAAPAAAAPPEAPSEPEPEPMMAREEAPADGDMADMPEEVVDALGNTGTFGGPSGGEGTGYGGLGMTGSGRGGGGTGEGTIGLRRPASRPAPSRAAHARRSRSAMSSGGGASMMRGFDPLGHFDGRSAGTIASRDASTARRQAVEQARAAANAAALASERAAAAEASRTDEDDRLRARSIDGLDAFVATTSGGRSSRSTSTHVSITISSTHHRTRCSDLSRRPLAERRAAWGERLSVGRLYPARVMDVLRHATRRCELRGFAARSAFLRLAMDRLGSVHQQAALYRALALRGDRNYVRRAILRRVRTPAEIAVARQTFGAATVQRTLIDNELRRARTDDERLDILRQLVTRYDGDLQLALRLMAMLEARDAIDEAVLLAERLRTHPLVDAEVRTALGEFFLRHDREAEARRVFSEIVEFSPEDVVARRRLGDLYRAHGWFDDAYRQYVTLAELRPDDGEVWLLEALAADGAGRTQEALGLAQRLAETSEPGDARGPGRAALLWASARLAQLRAEGGEGQTLADHRDALRRGGILRAAQPLRVTLGWAHPDARLSLVVGAPGRRVTRPGDLHGNFGIEAFETEAQADGTYRIEVRRRDERNLGEVEGTLTIVWNEGEDEERIQVVPVRFGAGVRTLRFTLEGATFSAQTEAE